jgi:hypothetical protein
MIPVRGPVHAAFSVIELPLGPLPKREEFDSKLTNSAAGYARFAKHFLGLMDQGKPLPTSYPCPVQVLRFSNDFTLVALGGEVVVDYSYRLKRELPDERLYVAGYCNDVFAYVPSVRILNEGGYEADTSMIYYCLPTRFAPEVEDLLVQRVVTMVKSAR